MPAAKQIFAFFGTDEARAKEDALKLSRKLTPEDNLEFGLEIVNGNAETSDHAASIVNETLAAIQTLPFLGGNKTIWLQGANFFADTVTGRAQATQNAVETLQSTLEAGLPDGVSLIISGSGIDKRRAFYKKLKKHAEMAFYDLPDPSKSGWETQVMAIAKKQASKIGYQFEPDALEHFVMMTGENTMQLQSELEKLGAYLGNEKTATVEDVRAVVATSRAGVIFEIGDALALRNLPRTIELIDYQLRRGENAIGLLFAAILPRVRALLVARDLLENHDISSNNYRGYEAALNRLPEEATAHLPRKKDGSVSVYPIFLASRHCRRFTATELKRGLHLCLEANRKLVTTQMDAGTVLSQLVTKMLTSNVRKAA